MKYKTLLMSALVCAFSLPLPQAKAGIGLLFVGSSMACYRGDKGGVSEFRKILGERMALGGFLTAGYALVILSPHLALLGADQDARVQTFVSKNFPYLADQPEVVKAILDVVRVKASSLVTRAGESEAVLNFSDSEIQSILDIAILSPAEKADLIQALR